MHRNEVWRHESENALHKQAIALTPMEKDVNNGSRVIQYFAITTAWAGEKELALQQLEAGLRAPAALLSP